MGGHGTSLSSAGGMEVTFGRAMASRYVKLQDFIVCSTPSSCIWPGRRLLLRLAHYQDTPSLSCLTPGLTAEKYL